GSLPRHSGWCRRRGARGPVLDSRGAARRVSDVETRCAVCGEPFDDARQRDQCGECSGWFHLNLRTDVEARSCGAAYVGNACGMTTYCDPCGGLLEAEDGMRVVRVGYTGG